MAVADGAVAPETDGLGRTIFLVVSKPSVALLVPLCLGRPLWCGHSAVSPVLSSAAAPVADLLWWDWGALKQCPGAEGASQGQQGWQVSVGAQGGGTAYTQGAQDLCRGRNKRDPLPSSKAHILLWRTFYFYHVIKGYQSSGAKSLPQGHESNREDI